jgi:hypothetical protein
LCRGIEAGAPHGGALLLCQRVKALCVAREDTLAHAPKFNHPPDGEILERVKGIEPSS